LAWFFSWIGLVFSWIGMGCVDWPGFFGEPGMGSQASPIPAWFFFGLAWFFIGLAWFFWPGLVFSQPLA
jgi:hypothetical protein